MQTVFHTIKETIDPNGEVHVKESSKTIKRKAEPSFVKVYTKDIGRLYCLPPNSEDVLWEMVKLVSYSGEVVLNAGIKRRMAKSIGCTPHSIDNSLVRLVKEGLIIKDSIGIYLLDPKLFAKGMWSDVCTLQEKLLRLTIDYAEGTRDIKVSLEDK